MPDPKLQRRKVRGAIIAAGYHSLFEYAMEKGFNPSTLQRVTTGERSGPKSQEIAETIYQDFGISLPARFLKTSNPTSKK